MRGQYLTPLYLQAINFYSLELRSTQLVKNVSTLKAEMGDELQHLTSLQERADKNEQEMLDRRENIREMVNEAKRIRTVIHKKHNIECHELYVSPL